MKQGDAIFGAGGLLAVLAVDQWNKWVAFAIALATLGILLIRLVIWQIRLRKEWRNRNAKPEPTDPD